MAVSAHQVRELAGHAEPDAAAGREANGLAVKSLWGGAVIDRFTRQ